jgi:hypothetical protein
MNRSARSQFCPNQRTEGSNRSIQQCSKETVNSMSLILCKLCCPLQVTYPMFAVFRATSSMTLDGDGSPRSTTSTAANIPLSADGGSEGGADDQQADEEGAERLSRGVRRPDAEARGAVRPRNRRSYPYFPICQHSRQVLQHPGASATHFDVLPRRDLANEWLHLEVQQQERRARSECRTTKACQEG